MAEITPRVYDIVHPSPRSLKELSAIAISLELWRVEEYRKHHVILVLPKIRKYYVCGPPISLKYYFPDLPTEIYKTIYEYFMKLGYSIDEWLKNHYKKGFCFHYRRDDGVLKDFGDFVGYCNGTVHYVRTAKRMMLCDKLSEAVKFTIACIYFFEDDIRRMWPSVCKMKFISEIAFSNCPQLYYWICCLTNQLNKLPSRENGSVDEIMFDQNMTCNGPSVKYFWNRLPYENRMRKAIDLYTRDKESFVRFILRELNDQELDEFVNEKGYDLMSGLLVSSSKTGELVLPTWMYIRNLMTQSAFTNLVAEILRTEGVGFTIGQDKLDHLWHFSLEIWNSAPNHLKPSALRDILRDHSLFESLASLSSCNGRRYVEFLLIILSSVCFKEREEFFHKFWHHLIKRTRSQDLQRIIKSCLGTDEEVARFKRNVIAESDHIRELCVTLLIDEWRIDQVNDHVDFCFPETRAARNFKQGILLRLTLLADDRSIVGVAGCFTKFNEFTDDAFNSSDQSTHFKNQLMESPVIQRKLTHLACSPIGISMVYKSTMKFIERFAASEQIVLEMKNRIIDYTKQNLPNNPQLLDSPFLLWCLGSKEEVQKFRRTRV
ncbi:uncharacterized protein LOC135848253 isoform X18 [Planococcus citri]|uniref:uncharacterized protein LOC135848253 isoform X18 n=1 Tax=Planococcus citri TaxID=170843 RepID=UPI0031F87C31